MNEHDWLTGDDPQKMLQSLEREWEKGGTYSLLSDRKLRLFACACCRLFPTHKEMFGVDASERFADGLMTPKELRKASQRTVGGGTWAVCHAEASEAARYVISDGHFRQSLPQLAALLRDIVSNPYRPPALPGGREVVCWDCRGYGNHLGAGPDRGNPECDTCRGTGKTPGPCPWLTPQVLSLAEAAYTERERKCDECGGRPSGYCKRCKEYGTIDDGTLDPFRLALLADALEEAGCDYPELLGHLRSPRPHYRGMWSLDLILGKS